MIAYQRIYRTDGSFHDVRTKGQLVYANADGHHHWHLQRIVAYSLWNFARTKLVAPAMKVGFCLTDHQHINPHIGPAKPVYNDAHGRAFCEKNNPAALSVWEGISAGWRDLYERKLVFQWVDVTDVQPGRYWLREDVDPTRMVTETKRISPPAYAARPSIVPGYDPLPFKVRVAAGARRISIVLREKRYGPTGYPQFRITRPPAHGKLNVQVGSLLNHATVIYRPSRGYRGIDHFRYQALDSASSYPRRRIAKTVTVKLG